MFIISIRNATGAHYIINSPMNSKVLITSVRILLNINHRCILAFYIYTISSYIVLLIIHKSLIYVFIFVDSGLCKKYPMRIILAFL